mmetsp:Transcript_20160/g.35830  ORF Transcript_20160/g.35830 Transcript_20160/m.35830 type:complete len:219 (+) Transcript_20160:509-1165(+)
MSCLDVASHLCNLPSDHRVLDQCLPEGLALVGELHSLLEADSAEAVRHGTDGKSLVVEVLHDVLKALVLLSQQVRLWNLDVVKGDVGGARRPNTGALHLPRLHARHVLLHEEEAQAAHASSARTAGHGEVVSEDAVGDPLLLAVEYVVVSFELGGGLQVGHIAACCRLCDGKAADFLTPQALWDHALLHLRGGMVVDGRQADGGSSSHSPEKASRARA